MATKKTVKKSVKKSVKKVVKKTIKKNKNGFDVLGKKNSLSKDAGYAKVRDALLKFAQENNGQVILCYGNRESHDCQTVVVASGGFVANAVMQLMKACSEVDGR